MQNSSKSRATGFLKGFFCLSLLVSAFFTYRLHKKSNYVPERNLIIEQTDDENLSHLFVNKNISNNYKITNFLIKIVKLFGYSANFGEYAIPHYASLFDAIKIVASGNVVIHKITLPEGVSVVQFVRRLNKDENLSGEIEEIPQEGSLLPDTYCFKYPTKKQSIISMAQRAMRKFIKKEWPKRSPKCTLKTPAEALILASIVEKETNVEREIIAGVYLHRMKINMKLESCPTAIYAHKKGDALEHPLKYSELTIDDPYNTYMYNGLPPTPITNPGRSSIIAVLHPQETDNLFFVYEGKGRHTFAKTYEEHKRNIARVRNISIDKVK